MENQTTSNPSEPKVLHFDLGRFEGFNFWDQSALDHLVSAEAVVNWDHDQHGEAEFWPAGDVAEVALIFNHRTSVTASELLDLDRVLEELGDDSQSNYLQIHYAVNVYGSPLQTLTAELVQDHCLHVFHGTSFLEVRREAAYELLELYYPEEYRVWDHSQCDGLIFDIDRFLDSPGFWTAEVRFGEEVAFLVAAQ